MAQEYTDGGAGWDDEEYNHQVKQQKKLIKEKKARETTDCRSEEGITVALVDSLIVTCRILSQRLKVLKMTPAIEEALKDFGSDEDVTSIVIKSGSKTFLSQLEVLRQELDNHKTQQ